MVVTLIGKCCHVLEVHRFLWFVTRLSTETIKQLANEIASLGHRSGYILA